MNHTRSFATVSVVRTKVWPSAWIQFVFKLNFNDFCFHEMWTTHRSRDQWTVFRVYQSHFLRYRIKHLREKEKKNKSPRKVKEKQHIQLEIVETVHSKNSISDLNWNVLVHGMRKMVIHQVPKNSQFRKVINHASYSEMKRIEKEWSLNCIKIECSGFWVGKFSR